MTALGTRVSGWLITGVGSAIAVLLIVDAAASGNPVYRAVESYPIALSLLLAGTGALLARGRLIADRYLRRLLAWLATGIVALTLLTTYLYSLLVMIVGRPPLDTPVGIITMGTFGALVGLLVGTYDVRALERKRVIEQLNQVNSTLRTATGELVQTSDRSVLEQAICDRLSESDAYEGACITRSDSDDSPRHPVAWAGVDDASVNALVAEDESATQRVFDRTVETRRVHFVSEGHVAESDAATRDDAAVDRSGGFSMALVPITETGRIYGVLAIFATDEGAFGEIERTVFTELGETVGHAIGSILAHEELEGRKRELVAHNERLDKFASVVSHDLRNPLNVILSRVELMQTDDPGADLDSIARAGHRMDDIITDLLSLSRAGADADVREGVPLALVVRDSWETVATEETRLDLRVPDEATVPADRVRLMHVFENLFRNATEHNDPPITIGVGLLESPREADTDLAFTGFFVEDDGDGIPADDRETVFDHGYTTNRDGTGFGLSIVKEIVDAHGWSISVTDGARGGARFEVHTADSPAGL